LLISEKGRGRNESLEDQFKVEKPARQKGNKRSNQGGWDERVWSSPRPPVVKPAPALVEEPIHVAEHALQEFIEQRRENEWTGRYPKPNRHVRGETSATHPWGGERITSFKDPGE